MKYGTERLIGSMGGALFLVVGIVVSILNFGPLLHYRQIPSVVSVSVAAALVAGLGVVLLIRYLLGLLVPLDRRGGGD